MDTLPICEAKSKQSGQRCRNFASKGKRVCRIHGGRSTGASTVRGRTNQKKASLKHGLRSREAIEEKRKVREFIKACKAAIN
jgi:hypothetical protein